MSFPPFKFLPSEDAKKEALKLMKELDNYHCIDFNLSLNKRNPLCSLNSFFTGKKGIMFGVLIALNKNKEQIVLKSFSGQFNGFWNVTDWAPGLIDPVVFDKLTKKYDPAIKKLTHKIMTLSSDKNSSDELILKLKKERKELSVNLNNLIQDYYIIENFRGEKKKLFDFFPGNPPTGTGDCNAPKLLNYCRLMQLKPLSMAEFYWGKDSESGNRKHKEFYPPCKERCLPIIPFMMEGSENL